MPGGIKKGPTARRIGRRRSVRRMGWSALCSLDQIETRCTAGSAGKQRARDTGQTRRHEKKWTGGRVRMRTNSGPTPSPVRAVYGRPDAFQWRFRRFLEVFRGLHARTSADARNFYGRYQRLHRQGPPHGQTRMFSGRVDDTLEATKHAVHRKTC